MGQKVQQKFCMPFSNRTQAVFIKVLELRRNKDPLGHKLIQPVNCGNSNSWINEFNCSF